MNKENEWNHNLKGDAVVCICREEVLQVLNETITGEAPGPSEVEIQTYLMSFDLMKLNMYYE